MSRPKCTARCNEVQPKKDTQPYVMNMADVPQPFNQTLIKMNPLRWPWLSALQDWPVRVFLFRGGLKIP